MHDPRARKPVLKSARLGAIIVDCAQVLSLAHFSVNCAAHRVLHFAARPFPSRLFLLISTLFSAPLLSQAGACPHPPRFVAPRPLTP